MNNVLTMKITILFHGLLKSSVCNVLTYLLTYVDVDGFFQDYSTNQDIRNIYFHHCLEDSFLPNNNHPSTVVTGGYQYNCLMLVHTYIYIIKIHSYQTTITHLLLLLGGYQYNCLMLGHTLLEIWWGSKYIIYILDENKFNNI